MVHAKTPFLLFVTILLPDVRAEYHSALFNFLAEIFKILTRSNTSLDCNSEGILGA